MKKVLFLLLLVPNLKVWAQTQEADILFKNVNVVTMEEPNVLKDQSIAVKDGKILLIGDSKTTKVRAKQTVNLKGKYILPSLADAHVHLPEQETDLQRFLDLCLINGVTKIRSMRGKWDHKQWQLKYNTLTSKNPKIYLSSPPITRDIDGNAEQVEAFVKAVRENDFKFIKILSLKDEKFFTTLDSLCKKYDVELAGHFPKFANGTSLNEKLFAGSNYRSIEHLGGLIGEPDTYESRIKMVKEKNIYICPTLYWYSVGSGRYSYDELRKLRGMNYVPKEVFNSWLEKTKAYREKMGQIAFEEEVKTELRTLDEKFSVINRLRKEGIKMLLSPDASTKYTVAGFNMMDEIELLKNTELTNFEILQMATSNFSDYFNEKGGRVKVGYPADFIIVSKNPLESLSTLESVEGLYFNYNYISAKELKSLRDKLLVEAIANDKK